MSVKSLATQTVLFGKEIIPITKLFILRKNVYALINLKPIVPGHVLIVSRRQVSRLKELTEIETLDLWVTVQQVSKVMEDLFQKECVITVQDGEHAGQTMDHVHVHVIPKGDQQILQVDNEKRQPRSDEEMIEEANKYRPFFEQSLL